jgi:hypothetical protein
MTLRRTLRLGQQWPDLAAANKFWIGADPMASGVQHADGLIILGRECSSLEELETVAAQIRADLDETLAEAKLKFGKA